MDASYGRGTAGLAVLLTAAACAEPGAFPASSSSTIVLDEARGRLFVTSPDDDSVRVLETSTLDEVARFAVPGAPEALAIAGDRLLVTRTATNTLGLLDPSTGELLDLPTPCGGTGAAAASDGVVLVTCPNDDLLLVLDAATGALEGAAPAPGRPTSVAISGDLVAVTAAREGALHLFDLAHLRAGAEDAAPLGSRAYGEGPGLAASQLDVLGASTGAQGFFALFQRVDHDSDRSRPPEVGGYGSVFQGSPRIAPRLAAAGCGADYARFDGGIRVASGPSAVAHAPATGTLWIAHRQTDNVLVFHCPLDQGPALPALAAGTPVLAAAFEVGRGPRGLALAADGRTAYVDAGFAHVVQRLELPASAPELPVAPALSRRWELGPERRFSPAGLTGRSLFFDAVNTHLTPSGVVTCGTCHPGGGEDGLSWFLHTPSVPRKLRRTPPAWSAKRALQPFHWDGELPDGSTLARAAIVGLMEGDGLVVDVSAIEAYLDELPFPPARPPRDPARWARGKVLFESEEVGCARCHPAPSFSDARAHEVLAPSLDPDGVLAEVDTPPLRGVRGRPPYLHDGRAATLGEVLTTFNAGDKHGVTSTLDDEARAALLEYLESL